MKSLKAPKFKVGDLVTKAHGADTHRGVSVVLSIRIRQGGGYVYDLESLDAPASSTFGRREQHIRAVNSKDVGREMAR